MCGRYTQLMSWQELVELYEITNLDYRPNLAPRYNAAPTQDMPVVRQTAAGRELAVMRWWLVPPWAKDDKPSYATFNARGEDAAKKPAFRAAFKQRRCLVPASGFYEWRQRGKGPKEPFYFTLADGRPMTFAGLWERWKGDGRVVESFTIVTTTANPLVAEIHAKKRMPVILEAAAFDAWLTGAPDQAQALIQTFPAEAMRRHAVSAEVNRSWDRAAGHPIDHPGLIEPIAA